MKKVYSKNEYWIVLVGFGLSMIHWSLCAVFFAALLYYIKQGPAGCVKGLLIIGTRGLISPALGGDVNGILGMEKWAVIFILSLAILLKKREYKKPAKLNSFIFLITIFALYVVISSLLVSSYPIISMFKVVSYYIPFCAIILGMSTVDRKEADWAGFMKNLLTPIILLSLALVPFDKFRIVNSDFQGAIEHPNMFGVFGAIYVAVVVYGFSERRKNSGERPRSRYIDVFLVFATIYMIYLSASRTGMFSALFILFIYFFTLTGKEKMKVFGLGVIFLLIIAVVYNTSPRFQEDFDREFNHFVFKHEDERITGSRDTQIDDFQEKFKANPVFGTGFGAPYKKGVRNYDFSFDVYNEEGNLAFGVIGDTGLVGAVLFLVYMIYMLSRTKRAELTLFVIPIVISMGEMAFFATNGVAILYYYLYGICMSDGGD